MYCGYFFLSLMHCTMKNERKMHKYYERYQLNGRKMLTYCRHFLGIPISTIECKTSTSIYSNSHTNTNKPFLCSIARFWSYIDSKTELLFWICWTISDKILTDILANILTFRMVKLLISISIQFNWIHESMHSQSHCSRSFVVRSH